MTNDREPDLGQGCDLALVDLLSTHPLPTALLDSAGLVVYVNPSAEARIGRKLVEQLLLGLDLKRIKDSYQLAEWSDSNGELRSMRMELKKIAQGETDHFCVTFSNLDGDVVQVGEKNPSIVAWQAVFSALEEMVLVVDDNLAVRHVNGAAEQLLRKARSELVGKRYCQLIHGDPEEPSYFQQIRNLREGEMHTVEREETYLNRHIRLAASRLGGNGADEVLYVLVLTDLTSRRKHEEEAHRLNTALAKSFRGITQALSDLVEIRDPYTAGHSGNVADLAARIGIEMGMSEEEIEGLRVCAMLHDIGKASVPSSILNKPGRLSEYEWGLLKEHPGKAYESLKHIPFPWPVAEVVHQHHERLDGSGYPLGISGDQIHSWARILAVADVVDAMSKHRPYRPRLPLKEVVHEVKRGRAVQYDAKVVDTYMELLRREANRVMVVDDEPLMLDFLTEVLRLDGLDVSGFNDPQEALKDFGKAPYPLVVTDLKMPEMDGFELIEQARAINPDTEVIVITGSGDKEGAVAALRLGARDFLEKPMEIRMLQEAVRDALIHYRGKD